MLYLLSSTYYIYIFIYFSNHFEDANVFPFYLSLVCRYVLAVFKKLGIFQPGLYGVYASGSYYRSWIDSNIAANGGATYCN